MEISPKEPNGNVKNQKPNMVFLNVFVLALGFGGM